VPERLAALDTEVLLALEAGVPECVNAHKILRKVGFLFRATPTVLQELERIQHDPHREYTAALAQNLLNLGTLQGLKIVSASMTDAERDITEIHAKTLMGKNVLTDAKHANMGDISALIEAAYADCILFITTTDDLLKRSGSLSLALIEICGMNAMVIVPPSAIK
jgi:hypothetical protein